jgi:hypothetical protein
VNAPLIRTLKKTLGGKSAEGGKLRRFGHGSKTVDGMMRLRSGTPAMNRQSRLGVK